MSESDVFHRATYWYGGIMLNQPLEIGGFRQVCFERIARYKRVAGVRPFPNIIHDFVDNGQFNAFAATDRGYHIVALYKGIFEFCYNIFQKMMGQKSFRPEIGDPANDADTPTVIDNLWDIKSWVNAANYSKNYDRQYYAVHLAAVACTFIFEHELTHVLHGHTLYCQSKYPLRALNERYTFRQTKNLELQTMEVLADQGALFRTSYLMMDAYKNPQVFKHSTNIFSDPYRSLLDVFFVAYSFFRLLGDEDYDKTKAGAGDHPQPRLRQAILMNSVYVLIDKINHYYGLNIDREQFLADAFKTVATSEAFYWAFTNKKTPNEVFKDEYFFANPMAIELNKYWNKVLRAKLLPYAYWPLPKD